MTVATKNETAVKQSINTGSETEIKHSYRKNS